MKIPQRMVRAALVGPLAGIGVAAVLSFALPGLIDRMEYITYYVRCQRLLGEPTQEQYEALRSREPDVYIVDIDDRSMNRLGNYWGWNRGYHARMLNALSTHYPAAIGFDMTFDNPEDRRYIERFDAVLERSSVREDFSEDLRRDILFSVDYDQRLADATRESGVVYHAVRMAQETDYPEHALSHVAYRTTEEWHSSMNPSSALSISPQQSADAIESRPILDGCFPALGRAAAALGFVNMNPNTDGVIREVPLLYRFDSTEAVYLPLSVRICASLFGTPNHEVEFRPGEYLDIGAPFKIFRTDEGEIRCSYPHMRIEQVRLIMEHASRILDCKRGHSVDIATYAVMSRDSSGETVLESHNEPLPAPVLDALSRVDFADVRSRPAGDRVAMGDSMWIECEDGTYALVAPYGIGDWYLSEHELTTLAAVVRQPLVLPPNEQRRLLFYPFSVRHQGGELVSTIPVLQGHTLRELCTTPWSRIESLQPGERLEFGRRVRIPLTRDNRHIITYFGPAHHTFRNRSFYSVMGDRGVGGVEGKIFLVGSTAAGLFDLKHAPLGDKYPGVEIHASLIRSILTNTFVRRLPSWLDTLILVLTGVTIGSLGFLLAPLPAALAVVAVFGLYVLTAVRVFGTNHLWIEMARPMLTIIVAYAGVMAYRYVTEEKDRKFLHSTFKAYLSPEIIDKMYKTKTSPRLGGEERVLTAYFTDIQRFSTFTEKLGSPTRLVELLNEYLTAMTDILLQHRGTLDKYEGDAILAFFGAPMPMADHAYQACCTALAMQRKLGALRDKWRNQGEKWPPIVHDMRMRIGINTGPITTGNMGSSVRMNYTMMGDAVNLAARLESAAKYYGVYTMISSYTYDLVAESFEVRRLDTIQVVGKSEPVVVYELLGEKGHIPPEYAALMEPYQRGLRLFYSREWEAAEHAFAESEALEPLRGVAPEGMSPSRRLLEYCRCCLREPPGPEWNGVAQLTSK